MSEYSKQIADLLIDHCISKGYVYDFYAEKGAINMRFALKNKLSSVRFYIRIKDRFYVSYCYIDMHCEPEHRTEVAKYLTMANYGLYRGNFEMDLSDGEIRYKYLVDCSFCMPTQSMIDESFGIPISMVERYGNELVKIMLGIQTAEAGIKIAESVS